VNPLFIALTSIAMSVAAQFSLKAGMSGAVVKTVLGQPLGVRWLVTILTDKFVLLGFLLYGLGAIVWLGVLSKWDVSKAYPLVGLGFAFTAAIGFLVGEEITTNRLLGVTLICAGVFLVGRS
jgi:drug/metabolite transporter (DMT)-like permease